MSNEMMNRSDIMMVIGAGISVSWLACHHHGRVANVRFSPVLYLFSLNRALPYETTGGK